MKRQVRLAQLAEYDLVRLADFLSSKSPAAADRAVERLWRAMESLAEFPLRGRPGPQEDLRELVVPFGREAYIAQYRVAGDLVLVVRLFHARERR